MLDAPIALASDVPRIHQRITDTQAELDLVNGHILSLETRRQMLQDTLTIHKYMVAPIRHLPNEILGEIFTICVDDAFDSPTCYAPRWNIAEAPLVLPRICKVWRDVALSNPRLWCSINMTLDFTWRSIEYAQKLIEFHSQRSRHFPWRIHIDLVEGAVGTYFDNDRIATAISAQSGRWEYASFDGITCGVLRALRDISLNLDSLKGLEVHSARSEYILLDGFQNAPQLTSLAISKSSPLHHGLKHFPYYQLTKLTVSEMPATYILDLVRITPALEKCTIVDCVGEVYNESWQSIKLPNLLSLTIIGTIHRYAIKTYGQNILKCLSVPLLTELSVQFRAEQNIADCILSLLSQSSCPLKKLSLETTHGKIGTTDEDVSAILEKTPTLEELKLSGHCVLKDQFLNHIIPSSESQTALCPKLQSFHFVGPLDLDGEFFQATVLPRLDKPDDLDRQAEFWACILWTAPLERVIFKLDLPELDG